MDMSRIVYRDKISVRDEEAGKLVYQRQQDHMYLVSDLGVRILKAYTERRSLICGLRSVGIIFEDLSDSSKSKVVNFLEGLLNRGLLIECIED